MDYQKTLFQIEDHNLLSSFGPDSLSYLEQKSIFQQLFIHKLMAKQKELTKLWNNTSDVQWTINKTIGLNYYIQQNLLITIPFIPLLDKLHSFPIMDSIQD